MQCDRRSSAAPPTDESLDGDQGDGDDTRFGLRERVLRPFAVWDVPSLRQPCGAWLYIVLSKRTQLASPCDISRGHLALCLLVREAAGAAEQAEPEDSMCVVCMDMPNTHAFVPCGHRCVCAQCSEPILHSNAKCPVCRADVTQAIKIF